MSDETQAQEVTSTAGWKAKKAKLVEMPSGNVARLGRPGMQSFVTRGLIPNSLMDPIQKAIAQGKDPDPAEMRNLASEPEAMMQFFLLIDDVCVEVFQDPKLHHILDDEGNPVERDENLLYVDEVDSDDKMFAFNYAVGGTQDVAQFRQEQKELLAVVSPGEGVESSTE